MQKIVVPFEYPVYFTQDVFEPGNPDFAEALTRIEPDRCHRFCVVIDSGVDRAWPNLTDRIRAYAQTYPDNLELVANPIVVPGGESIKSDIPALENLLNSFHSLALDRQSFVVIVGGGAVQDMAGYAAAICHRGLRTIRLPTTVLSQNDSGVGVKNGVNAFDTKNFLGTFAPPFAVINDIRFIDTLSDRDRLAGFPEAVKVALIRDASFFHWLEGHAELLMAFDPKVMEMMIERGARLHLAHIATSGDPFEFGAARPLDFGHWSAHKLESMTDYRLRHGEAVAIGMALDTRYSVLAGLLDEPSGERVCDLLKKLGMRLWDDALDQTTSDGRRTVLDGLDDFRQHLGGDLTVTLLQEIGRGVEVHEVDTGLVDNCIAWLSRRERQ